MKSKIKLFRIDAEFDGKEFDFDGAKSIVLKEFDDWRMGNQIEILSIHFGRKHGLYIEEDSHYWYIEVLYDE